MTEHEMKAALDGKFYAFSHDVRIGTLVLEKSVPKTHTPIYNFENRHVSNAGRWARAAYLGNRRSAMWTEARIAELKKLHRAGYGTKRIEKLMRLGRVEIERQLNKMGLLNRKGLPYK